MVQRRGWRGVSTQYANHLRHSQYLLSSLGGEVTGSIYVTCEDEHAFRRERREARTNPNKRWRRGGARSQPSRPNTAGGRDAIMRRVTASSAVSELYLDFINKKRLPTPPRTHSPTKQEATGGNLQQNHPKQVSRARRRGARQQRSSGPVDPHLTAPPSLYL